jgi:hypothetical protein
MVNGKDIYLMELSNEQLKPLKEAAEKLTYDEVVTLISGMRDARLINALLFILSRVKRTEDDVKLALVLDNGEPVITVPAKKAGFKPKEK